MPPLPQVCGLSVCLLLFSQNAAVYLLNGPAAFSCRSPALRTEKSSVSQCVCPYCGCVCGYVCVCPYCCGCVCVFLLRLCVCVCVLTAAVVWCVLTVCVCVSLLMLCVGGAEPPALGVLCVGAVAASDVPPESH